MKHLYEELLRYGQGEDYPFHMPGHKRRLCGELPPSLFQMDITEIDGFDNLHEPEGLIAGLQERIAAFYGAKKSYCLVGSSTAGILSAVSAALPMGGHILMARNCHKSAYHAAYLRRLRISYLKPRILEDFGIADGITAQQVKEALQRDSSIDAVLIVSPTYEGRISPLVEIANVVHGFGKTLIVDEAHGAHLVLGKNCENDVQTDAYPDLVIQSIHKTLPALTQTAVLHVYGSRVKEEMLERFLHIYQSSSPSYILMAGVDNCFTILEKQGRELYQRFSNQFFKLVAELRNCKNIRILAAGCADGAEYAPAKQDVGKLLLFPEASRMSGQQLYDLLREEYHLQLEMAAPRFCLAMFTIGDTEEGFSRMRDAVLEIDRRLEREDFAHKQTDGMSTECLQAWETIKHEKHALAINGNRLDAKAEMFLYEAWDKQWEEVPLSECEGRIAADFINLYPPGTPILVPGERFTKEICEYLSGCYGQGLRIQGLSGEKLSVKCISIGEQGVQGE